MLHFICFHTLICCLWFWLVFFYFCAVTRHFFKGAIWYSPSVNRVYMCTYSCMRQFYFWISPLLEPKAQTMLNCFPAEIQMAEQCPTCSTSQNSLCLPECGLEDLSGGALFGVVVVSVEKVPKHGLVSRDVHCLPTVDSLSAGFRQRQAWPPIWTTLVVLNAPGMIQVLVV